MRKFSVKLVKVCVLLLVMGALFLLGKGYIGYKEIVKKTPIKATIENMKVDTDYVKIENIEETFLDAIVAVEDHRFYRHGAIDVIGITRATVTNFLNGEIMEGGSTITQQLAKNIFLSRDQTLIRKIKEMFIANEIEKQYTKDEILEVFVNVIYYGDGYTGIGEASEGYFGKKPSELTLNESTLLAGIPQAPSIYALSKNNPKTLERQKEVINAYHKWGNTEK